MVDTCADPTTVVMGFDSTLGKNTFTFSESRLVSVYDNLMRVNVTLDQMKEAIGLQVGEFIFQSGEIEKIRHPACVLPSHNTPPTCSRSNCQLNAVLYCTTSLN